MAQTAEETTAIDWTQASMSQITDIIFQDEDCPIEYKWQALNEMRRRRHGQNKPEPLQDRRD